MRKDKKAKTKPISIPHRIGNYGIGPDVCQLWLVHGDNGYFQIPNPIVKIGVGVGETFKNKWAQTFYVLMHESMEYAFYKNGLRYNASLDYSTDNGNFSFHMSHTKFAEAVSWAAMFIRSCQLDLRRALDRYWREYDKKIKQAKAGKRGER